MHEAEASGIDVFLQKPVSPSALFDAAMDAIGQVRAQGVRPREAQPQRRFAPGVTVLVVEDNEINRLVARELLAAAGVETECAESGEEALQRCAQRRYDTVLMDIQMPGLDGIETTRRLKADARLASMPVVALTAHAMASDRERFLEAGMDDYLAKPIDEAELIAVLARWLPTVTQRSDESQIEPALEPGLPRVLQGVRGIDIPTALDRVNRNADLLARLVTQLHARHADAVPRIRALIDAGDWKAAADAAHNLKGAAATLAAERIAAASARLEVALRQQTPAPMVLDELHAALLELRPPIAAQAAPAIAASEATRPDPTPLLARFAEELAQNRFSARATFVELRAALAHTGSQADLDAIAECVERLDFAAALQRLPAMSAAIGGAAP
jgi:two-component system sensor histidine kinase/response regulator